MIDIYIYFKSSLAKLSGAQVETQPGEDHSDDPWMPQNPGNPPVWVRGASYSEESYRALWTSQEGRALPADGTGWVWLGTTPNALGPPRIPIGTCGSRPEPGPLRPVRGLEVLDDLE